MEETIRKIESTLRKRLDKIMRRKRKLQLDNRKIDLALKKRGNNWFDLAEYLQVSQQVFKEVMRGQMKFNMYELKQIAEFLDLPLIDILNEHNCSKMRYRTLMDAYNAGVLQLADVYSQMHSQYNYLLCMGANEQELYAYSQYIEQLEKKILEDYMHKQGYIWFSLGN